MESSPGFGHHLLRRDSFRPVPANLLHSCLNLCVPGPLDLGCCKILDARHQFLGQRNPPRRRPFQDFLFDGVLCNRHRASFRHDLGFCKFSFDSSMHGEGYDGSSAGRLTNNTYFWRTTRCFLAPSWRNGEMATVIGKEIFIRQDAFFAHPLGHRRSSEKSASHARRRPGRLTPRFAWTRDVSLFAGWHWSALLRRIARRSIETQAENFFGIPADLGGGMHRPP